MAQVPSGSDAIQLTKGSVVAGNPIRLAAVKPNEPRYRTSLKIDFKQAAGDPPSQNEKGIPPSLLRHVTPQPYKNSQTSPAVASVKDPVSAVPPRESAASITKASPVKSAIKASSGPDAPSLANPADSDSNKTEIATKDGNGIPQSSLHNVTPQPNVESGPHPVQSVIDLFNSKNDPSNGVNTGSRKSLRRAGPSSEDTSDQGSKPSETNQNFNTTGSFQKSRSQQIDPRTKIVSSSGRPRLIEPGYKRAIPIQLQSRVEPSAQNQSSTKAEADTSVKYPGSTVPTRESAASITKASPIRPAIKTREVASSGPNSPSLANPAESNNIDIAPKDGNGIPQSLLRHVTPQPYKYTETSPQFASVKAPVSADQPRETVAQIPKVPSLPIPAVSTKVSIAPKDNHDIPPSLLPHVTPQPYRNSETSSKLAGVKFAEAAAESNGRGSIPADAQRPTAVSNPSFPSGPNQQNRALLAAPNNQSSISTESQASTFANSSISSISNLVADPKKDLGLQNSDGNPRAASAPSSRHTVGFVQPPATEALGRQTNLGKPQIDSSIKESVLSAAKSEAEPNRFGVSSLPVKSGTEPRQSGTAKTDPEPRKFGPDPVPANPDTELRKSEIISISDISGVDSKKSDRTPRRSSSGTDSRKVESSPHPVQSVIDLFNSKNDPSNGVNTGSRKSLRRAGPSSDKSDLGSNPSGTSQNTTRSFQKLRSQQIDPRTKIVSSSGRPRLVESGYKRAIPVQSQPGVEPSTQNQSSTKPQVGSSRSGVSDRPRDSSDRRSRADRPDRPERQERRDNSRRRDNSQRRLGSGRQENRTSGGDYCKVASKLTRDCDDKTRRSELEKCSADRNDKTRQSELKKCSSDYWKDCDYKVDCRDRNAARGAVMPNVHPITAGSTDACLPVCQWQPFFQVSPTNNCYPVNQRRNGCLPTYGLYRSRPMCDPYCDPPSLSSPCPRPVCTRPCDPCGPRPVCPQTYSPCARPASSPCQQSVYPRPCLPCPRPICPRPCSPCGPRPMSSQPYSRTTCPQPCSPCPRPICPQQCSLPCSPRPICPRSSSPPPCPPCDPPVCPPRPCSPCLPPVISIPCSPPACYAACPQAVAYPCREECNPECDLNQCKPLVKPASREVPDNFKCIPNLQQQFLINAGLRNASAATATATNIYGGTGCSAEPLSDSYPGYGNSLAVYGGVLRHVAPSEVGRNRCSTLRPTPELQRILDYRRQIEDEWEAFEEVCGPECGIGCNCIRRD